MNELQKLCKLSGSRPTLKRINILSFSNQNFLNRERNCQYNCWISSSSSCL